MYFTSESVIFELKLEQGRIYNIFNILYQNLGIIPPPPPGNVWIIQEIRHNPPPPPPPYTTKPFLCYKNPTRRKKISLRVPVVDLKRWKAPSISWKTNRTYRRHLVYINIPHHYTTSYLVHWQLAARSTVYEWTVNILLFHLKVGYVICRFFIYVYLTTNTQHRQNQVLGAYMYMMNPTWRCHLPIHRIYRPWRMKSDKTCNHFSHLERFRKCIEWIYCPFIIKMFIFIIFIFQSSIIKERGQRRNEWNIDIWEIYSIKISFWGIFFSGNNQNNPYSFSGI